MPEVTLQQVALSLNEMIAEHNKHGAQIVKLAGYVKKMIDKQNATAKIVAGLKTDVTADLTEVDQRLRKLEAGAGVASPAVEQATPATQPPPSEQVVDGEVMTISDDDPFLSGGED